MIRRFLDWLIPSARAPENQAPTYSYYEGTPPPHSIACRCSVCAPASDSTSSPHDATSVESAPASRREEPDQKGRAGLTEAADQDFARAEEAERERDHWMNDAKACAIAHDKLADHVEQLKQALRGARSELDRWVFASDDGAGCVSRAEAIIDAALESSSGQSPLSEPIQKRGGYQPSASGPPPTQPPPRTDEDVCRYCAGKGGKYRYVYSRYTGTGAQAHQGPWEKCSFCNGTGKKGEFWLYGEGRLLPEERET